MGAVVFDRNNETAKILSVFKKHTNLRFTNCFNSFSKAMQLILQDNPKLILINLDAVNQPFDFLQNVKKHLIDSPYFIGITSNHKLAYTAFKKGFDDVLVTPFGIFDGLETLSRFNDYRNKQRELISFKSFRDHFYLKPDEILYLKADNYTTDVFLKNGDMVGSLQTLKSFEPILPLQFRRIQKSIIINTSYLYHVDHGKKRCRLLGVANEFKYSVKYIPKETILKRTV